MKFFRKCAMTAGLMCAASAAQAQYYPYAAPGKMPAPPESRQMAYQNWASYNEGVPAPTPTPADGSPAPVGNKYDRALAGSGTGCCDTGCNNGCNSCCSSYVCGGGQGLLDCCGPKCYGGAAALYMTRNKPNPYQVSFDTTNPVGELILNIDTCDDWTWGWEATVGRYVGCNSAIEFTYWGLGDFDGSAYATNPPGIGSLNTPFDFRSLNFDDGVTVTPVNDLYDGAEAHCLTRSDETLNFEINFVNYPMLGNTCSPVQLNWFAGVRYFRFAEDWSFDTADNDPTFGNDPASEAYFSIDTSNNLIGLQIGSRITYCCGSNFSLFATPRFGVYWNNLEQHSRIESGAGLVALDLTSERDVCSLMGQVDVGGSYQITQRWSVYAGYRVVAISGIALSDAQIPYLQDDLFGYTDIDHNSNLVLHGAVGGLRFNY